MLLLIRVVPVGPAATGPLITRSMASVVPCAVTTMLGSPGQSGPPSGSSPSPGTSVASASWMADASPVTSSWPASHAPLISSRPAGAGWPVPAGPATPVTSMSPVIVTRESLQTTSRGPPGGTGSPATMARLLPAGSCTPAG